MPFLPPEVHRTPILMAVMVHDGDGDGAAGERAFAPFRPLAKPNIDQVQPIRFAQVYDGPEPPRLASMAVRSLFVEGVEIDVVEGILDGLHRSPAPLRIAQFRVLGGAVARARGGHRVRPPGPPPDGRHLPPAPTSPRATRLRTPPGPTTLGRAEPRRTRRICRIPGRRVPRRVREAYAAPTWERLRATKARYDPTNLFRLNQNVPPAEG